MITATWKRGFESLHKGVDPQRVAEEIISIGDDATPQQIVETARDASLELHRCFTWDNQVAADKWRLQEARLLVCHLVIQNEDPESTLPEVRYFYKNDAGGYKQSAMIFRRMDEYQMLLEKARTELHAFKTKYNCLQELDEILALID